MTTEQRVVIRVPRVYGRKSISRMAYRQAFQIGYRMTLQYLESRREADAGRYPDPLPEFRGRSIAEHAWRQGCVDGGVACVRDYGIGADLLESAAAEMDAIERAEMADAARSAARSETPPGTQRLTQAELDAQAEAAHAEARNGMFAVVIACGGAGLLFLAGLLWLWLAYSGPSF